MYQANKIFYSHDNQQIEINACFSDLMKFSCS